jgi:glycosyltransferase involved in cell wall biosynthesis
VHLGIDSHSAEHEGEGNATYTRYLIAALLDAAGADDFTLFAAHPTHPVYRALPRPARLVGVRQGRGLARLAWALARAASREDVDCLHVQYVAPLRYRRPLVLTVHDLGFLHEPASLPPALRLALRLLVPRSIAHVRRVITVSEFARQDILAHYPVPPAKVVAIPLAAAPGFRPAAPAETAQGLARYGLRPGFLFSLGRLNRRKNLERLLLAHARLHASGVSDAPLVIGGKRDYGVEAVLRQARRLGPAPAIRWMGLIPDHDLPLFYSGAACFIYASLFEGFGLPVLEAMACGTPVVTSNRAALPELAGDAALVIDPTSVDALADAIARVLREPALADTLRARGLARSQQYSWAETARRTLAVYRDAVSR